MESFVCCQRRMRSGCGWKPSCFEAMEANRFKQRHRDPRVSLKPGDATETRDVREHLQKLEEEILGGRDHFEKPPTSPSPSARFANERVI
jgi:hypothetical protein